MTPASRKALAAADAARSFPANTCPASRHVAMIGEALVRGERYGMLASDPASCGHDMLAVVTALWRERDETKRLRALCEAQGVAWRAGGRGGVA